MKRLLTMTALTGLAAMAMALITYEKAFYDHYKIAKGSAVEKMKCMPCHQKATGGKLNSYGEELQAAMKAAGSKKVTPAILTAVDGKDSDKDGMANGAEVKAGRNPGAAG